MNCRSNRRWATTALAALSSLAMSESGLAAGDPARGAKIFQACMACHTVAPGVHMTGPSLAAIWGPQGRNDTRVCSLFRGDPTRERRVE